MNTSVYEKAARLDALAWQARKFKLEELPVEMAREMARGGFWPHTFAIARYDELCKWFSEMYDEKLFKCIERGLWQYAAETAEDIETKKID
jgi:hypothetical protein